MCVCACVYIFVCIYIIYQSIPKVIFTTSYTTIKQKDFSNHCSQVKRPTPWPKSPIVSGASLLPTCENHMEIVGPLTMMFVFFSGRKPWRYN